MLSRILGFLRGQGALIRGVDKLPDGQSKRVELGDALAGGTEVVLCRVGGRLHALDRLCPHEGGRIADGPLLDGVHLICPLHNYRFDPRTGKAVGVACPDAKVYRVREKGADCEVFI
jgi:nitrite reductase/ring-hydroxylating ferredoxin subunit